MTDRARADLHRPDVVALLADAERAVFSGPPAAALPLLAQVRDRAGDGPDGDRAAWLQGVALVGAGRFGAALAGLLPLAAAGHAPEASPERRSVAALAAATVAGAHRQLGRHAAAREADDDALALAATPEAVCDALLGLAADAVGLQDPAQAAGRLAEAEQVLAGAPADRWRPRVRLDRVGAELALLDGRPDDAAALATRAAQAARAAGGQRHVAKALLVLGLTQVSAGSAAAVPTLREAADVAGRLGALPVLWPARALLGALLAADDPADAAACLAQARTAVEAIAADLPPGVQAAWLARPEVAALRASRPGDAAHPPG